MLNVDAGTFAENVVVTKSVQIIGAGQGLTTVEEVLRVAGT